MSAEHPEWCRLDEDDTSPHESETYLIRNRDGIQVEIYFVDYGLSALTEFPGFELGTIS